MCQTAIYEQAGKNTHISYLGKIKLVWVEVLNDISLMGLGVGAGGPTWLMGLGVGAGGGPGESWALVGAARAEPRGPAEDRGGHR